MNARYSLLISVICLIPILLWLLFYMKLQTTTEHWPQLISQSLQTLCLMQIFAVLLLTPWQTLQHSWKHSISHATVLVAVSLPLYVTAWLSNAISIETLLTLNILVIACAVCVFLLVSFLERLSASSYFKSLSRATIQLLLAVTVWVFRENWLTWMPT